MSAMQTYLEQPRDIMDGIYERLEAKEAAIRSRIESEPEALANAVCAYYDNTTVHRCDGPELLTEFTLALAGAEALLNAVCRGDDLPDSELSALRKLLMQVETAKRRQVAAVEEAVDVEMAK